MHPLIREAIGHTLGQPVVESGLLRGGMVGAVYWACLADEQIIVAKVGETAEARLDVEGEMLRYLRRFSRLPVPEVFHAEPALLVMEYVPGENRISDSVQEHAADLMAALHGITSSGFGLDFDTLIGGLRQPNPWSDDWIDFFRDQRLLYMADVALRAGVLPLAVRRRIDALAARLEDWLIEPEHPALIHGDLWTGNILAFDGAVAAFIDPAIYYADPEIELAFTTLFGTFDDGFFVRYAEQRPIQPGFFEERRDLYNLYPLLVHVRLFGGHYVDAVERTLDKYD
ncbi:MAG: fructosamine kinase family protein [Anaerolineae bacterium]|nr:fructosamine kinase family protein [Anaerolineae bacterium]